MQTTITFTISHKLPFDEDFVPELLEWITEFIDYDEQLTWINVNKNQP